MWLLLGLAPIFIVLLLFGVTSRFFSGWLATLVQYFIVQVMVYAFIAFYVGLTHQFFDRLNTANNGFTTPSRISRRSSSSRSSAFCCSISSTLSQPRSPADPHGLYAPRELLQCRGQCQDARHQHAIDHERIAARRMARMQNVRRLS